MNRQEWFEKILLADEYKKICAELEAKDFVISTKDNHRPLFESGGFWIHPALGRKQAAYSGKQLTWDRFILIENNPEFPIKEGRFGTAWYWDLRRPQSGVYPFKPVQCYLDRDPNSRVEYDELYLLFTDQAEYYAVCGNCKAIYGDMQWSGSTTNPSWRNDSQDYLKEHLKERGWCTFCDPAFGNGGWIR